MKNWLIINAFPVEFGTKICNKIPTRFQTSETVPNRPYMYNCRLATS